MTAIDTTRPINTSGFGHFVSSAIESFSAWNDARVTRKALSKLSNRELEDIGLCRGDIEDIFR